jgi:hypothetical protein
MFNKQLKEDAIYEFEKSVKLYDATVKDVQEKAEKLFLLRQSSSDTVIKLVENYINSLANSPKEFNKSFAEYRAEFKTFTNLIEKFNAESLETNVKTGSIVSGGVAAGVGTAALMPSAAMAIATTFGTASTGTAIASLSGAAASKAALAWLGGGALAKGGAGIVGGKALLALSGPIGWGIGGVAILGGGLFMSSKNKKIAQDVNKKRKEVETANASLKAANIEIKELINLTNEHQKGVLGLLNDLQNTAPNNYSLFKSSEKEKLTALINHINSLSALLNKKIA